LVAELLARLRGEAESDGTLDRFDGLKPYLVNAAQYKGVGSVNGTSGFGFMLTAIDGQLNGGGGTDKFRIKIWDIASSVIVYDNQMGATDSATPSTVIGGGSIQIQK
jgi:hypothetical protein